MPGQVESGQKRDAWDVFTSVSAFMSSVVIAGAALWVNSTYNDRQQEMARSQAAEQHQLGKIQALAAFMPHLSADNPTREAALFGIAALGYSDLALKLTQLRGPGEKDVADALMRTAPASAPLVAAPAPPDRPAGATQEELGWVYVGDYSGVENRWTTWYLEFDPTVRPSALDGRTLAVRRQTGALNLRRGMPTDQGEFPPVTRSLAPGTRVKILEIRPWLTTSYIWARVARE